MGISLPPLDAILFTSAGLVIPPVMTSYLMSMLPTTLTSSKIGYYAVKAAAVLGSSLLVRKFVSQRAGNFMLIGGAASLALDLVSEFAPGLIPRPAAVAGMGAQPFLGFYERMPSRIPAGNGMGRYTGIPVQSRSVQRTPIMSTTPDRLLPEKRF